MTLTSLLVLSFVALCACVSPPSSVVETYLPRVYSPHSQMMVGAGSTIVHAIPMCGHERLQFSNVTVNMYITLGYTTWADTPMFVRFYRDEALTQQISSNFYGVNYLQSWTFPYSLVDNSQMLYMVATNAITTKWTFSISFGLLTTRFVPGVVNTPPEVRVPMPSTVNISGVLYPVYLANQYILPVQGSVLTNPLLDTSFKFVTSVCVLDDETALETYVQVMDLTSRIYFYVCANGNSTIVPGVGCPESNAMGGARQASGAAWSRAVVPTAQMELEELHGAIDGIGQLNTLSNFVMTLRLVNPTNGLQAKSLDFPYLTS